VNPAALVQPVEQLLPLGLVLARIVGFLASAPFFSSRSLPLSVRAGFALAMALALAPSAAPGGLPASATALLVLTAKEILVGLFFGLALQWIFGALQLAGQLAGLQVGFATAGIMDPSTQARNNLGPALYQFLGLMLFLGSGGHRELTAAFMETYRIVPLGEAAFRASVFQTVLGFGKAFFETGLRLAAPVAVTLFIIDLALALVGRVAPSIPILLVGMPAKAWLGLAFLGWGLTQLGEPAAAWLSRTPAELLGLARGLSLGSR
jgi:flagellar biosynthetic protein FliR